MRRLGYTTILGITFGLLSAGYSFATPPIVFETGTYVLENHPDGNAAEPFYGMRLDDLWGQGTFTFDFECDDCGVTMVYDGSSIDISGIAYGGHPDDDEFVDDDFDGRYELSMHYDLVVDVENDEDGLQDIGVDDDNEMMATGSLMFLDSGELSPPSWALTDKAGSHDFSVRIGDEDDDEGHRGFDGISGWGWLLFAPIESLQTLDDGDRPRFENHDGSQDFLFTARRVPVPVPPTAGLLLLGIAALGARRKS